MSNAGLHHLAHWLMRAVLVTVTRGAPHPGAGLRRVLATTPLDRPVAALAAVLCVALVLAAFDQIGPQARRCGR